MFATVCSLLVASCDKGLPVDKEGKVKVKIGSVVFRIPEEHFLPDLPAAMIPQEGLDEDYGISIEIPYEKLGIQPTGRSRIIIVELNPRSVVSLEMLPSLVNAAWLGTGDYKDRVVSVDEKSGLVYVHPNKKLITEQMVFTRYPEDGVDGFQFWVAACYPISKECVVRFFFHDVYVSFGIPTTESHLVLEFRQRVHKLLESWVEH
jgi:hypothetical protein